MSLRFGSGWLVIYFLICSCTFICSASQLRARDYTTFNPFEPLPFSVTPDTRFWVTFSPLQGRAALTVEVTRPRGRPASRCCVGAFQNSQRLEMSGAPRSGQRGWSTCTPNPSSHSGRIVGKPYLTGLGKSSPLSAQNHRSGGTHPRCLPRCFSELAVFDALLDIHVRRVDEPA